MYCAKCKKQFEKKLDFDIHLEICNCKYICITCKKVFKKHLAYIKHGNVCHIMKFYRSKCKYCGKIYTKRGLRYLNHIRKCEIEIIKTRTDEYKDKRSYKYFKIGKHNMSIIHLIIKRVGGMYCKVYCGGRLPHPGKMEMEKCMKHISQYI